MIRNTTAWAVVSTLLTCLAGPATSQVQRGYAPLRNSQMHAVQRPEQRARIDRVLPAMGYPALARPPFATRAAHGGGGHHAGHGGARWGSGRGRYWVVAPAMGLYVATLPFGYVKLQVNDAPYYYANGTYYEMLPSGGYTVVVAPVSAIPAQPLPAESNALAALAIQARNGQSNLQREADQQACNELAATQVGAATEPAIFQRSFAVCMDGLGYTVR